MQPMRFQKGRHRPAHFKRWDAQAPYKTERAERKDRLGIERRAKPRPKRPPAKPIKPGPAVQPWLFVDGRWYACLDEALAMIRPPHLSHSRRPNLVWEIQSGKVWIGRFEIAGESFQIGVRADKAQDLMAELLT